MRFRIMGLGAFIRAIISPIFRKKSPFFNALMISTGVLLGMLSRIFWDLIQDPTSHNLFPFELMMSLAIVVPATFLGAFLTYSIFFDCRRKADQK